MKYTINLLKGGTVEGCPTYTGVYMRAGTLVFRQIVSPRPIDWSVGDFVDYSDKTGFVYYLMDIPQAKKQARCRFVGDSFIYENVTFYDYLHYAELWPFRDLVAGDNTVHFSSRQTFSTYEAVSGIARRIQASFDAMQSGLFQVVVSADAPTETRNLMAEAREFSVTDCSILDALNKIYDVWPGVGWCYEPIVSDGAPVGAKIIIGGTYPASGNYAYGIGRGLKSLSRVPANVGEVVNQIFPFGGTTNVNPDYYRRNSQIRNNASLDIVNLMLPVTRWGTTDGKYDPAKAYILSDDSLQAEQLRPKRVYFDGSNDLENIYPTIKGVQFGYVNRMSGLPVPPVNWPDGDYVDQIIRAVADKDDSSVDFDTGQTGEDGNVYMMRRDGTQASAQDTFAVGAGSASVQVGIGYKADNVSASIGEVREFFDFSDYGLEINVPQANAIRVAARVRFDYNSGGTSQSLGTTAWMDLEPDSSGQNYHLPESAIFYSDTFNRNSGIYPRANLELLLSFNPQAAQTITWKIGGTYAFGAVRDVRKNFNLYIPPFGYDLTNIVSTDGEIRIAMTSGPCAGREFVVKKCVEGTHPAYTNRNCLVLTLERQFDDSLSTYFPNSSYYPIPGDTFVILGIAMPEIYMSASAYRLLSAAQQYLAENSKTIWQYTPEIDAKYMIDNGLTIKPGQYMVIIDPDIVASDNTDYLQYLKESGDGYYLTDAEQKIVLDGGGLADVVLVDSVTINEGESNIPTWKVVLRDRKKK